MYCLLIYISVEFKLSLNVTHHFTWYSLEMNLWANASICSDAMKTLFPKSLKKKLTCCGVCCVSPPTDHYDGTGAIPRGGLARPDAHQPLQPQRCELQRTAANVDVHQLCRTYTPHCSQAPTVSWFPRPDLAGPCLGGSPPPTAF